MIKAEKGLGVNVQCKQSTKRGRNGQIPSLTDGSSSALIILALQHEREQLTILTKCVIYIHIIEYEIGLCK